MLIALLLAVLSGAPQVDDVADAVRRADAEFWGAYNACDRGSMSDAFTQDAEFYHDVTGLTSGREAIVESLMRGPCGSPDQHLRREVGTLEVHRLAGPYVLLTGTHLFHVSKAGEADRISAQARFADIWRFEDGRWRMARVVSFDHGPPPFTPRPPDPTFDPATLPDFAGRYEAPGFGEILIHAEQDGLRLTSGNLDLEFQPIASHRFAATDRDLEIQFHGDQLTVLETGAVVATAVRRR